MRAKQESAAARDTSTHRIGELLHARSVTIAREITNQFKDD